VYVISFLQVEEKNKINSFKFAQPVKKLNASIFQFCHYRIRLLSVLIHLLPTGVHMLCGGLSKKNLSATMIYI
jgi:hypothetical protein